MGNVDHLEDVCKNGLADAVAIADVLHYDRTSLPDIREEALRRGIAVRAEVVRGIS